MQDFKDLIGDSVINSQLSFFVKRFSTLHFRINSSKYEYDHPLLLFMEETMWTMTASRATMENNVAKKDKQQIAAMKAKRLSFKKRKACIKKKTMELSVLCDIEACVVIVDGNGEVETWPENQSSVMKIITRYKNCVHAGDDKNEYACDQGLLKDSVFCGDQNQNMVLNLHSWDDHLIDGLPIESLQEVLRMVDAKLEAMARRIEALKRVDDHNNDMGKEIVVFGEASVQNIIQTPYTSPGSMCLSGGEYLNQQIIEAPNFGWFEDGSSFCFNSNILGSSAGIDLVVNNNQIIQSFVGDSEQGFFNMLSRQQTPCFFGQESDQIVFNMPPPGMYPPPQFSARGLFPRQSSFGIGQNRTGLS